MLDDKNAEFVLGDKAFDSDKILKQIETMGAIAVIPPTANRKEQREYDKYYVSVRQTPSY